MSAVPDENSGNYIVRRQCIVCRKPSSVSVPPEVLKKMNEGAFVQDAWPDATPGQRETLISGTHEECFEQLYTEEDAL